MACAEAQGAPVDFGTPLVYVDDISSKYDVAQQLSRGGYAEVLLAFTKGDAQPRALKRMDRAKLEARGKTHMVTREKEIMRRCHHPNILRLYDTFYTADKIYFALDLMQRDLYEVIVGRPQKKLREVEAASVMVQLLSAVAYLHSISIVHRDIKPENILVNEFNDGRIEVKLADFGLAKIIENLNTPCGTSFYIAPEIMRAIELEGVKPLTTTSEEVKMTDVWACGVVLFVMLAGRPPFYGQVKTREDRRLLLQRLDRGLCFPAQQWSDISEDAMDLCARLLNQDPKQRITAADALKHPFLKIARVPAVVEGLTRAESSHLSESSREPLSPDEVAMLAEFKELAAELRQAADKDPDGTAHVGVTAPAANQLKATMGPIPVDE